MGANANTPGIVYVVDGDPAVRDSLRSLLAMLELEVETYDSAEAFLEGARIRSPACLIAEAHLPGRGGIELLHNLHQHGVDLPTVITTTRGDVPMAVRALRAGAIDFFEKPFVGRALTDRVVAAIAGQRSADRDAPR